MRTVIFVLLSLLLAACAATADVSGPRLVAEVTLGPPTAILPTRELSVTPPPITPEILSPLQVVTVDGNFVLVTPTLPPSKTPTLTPTQSLTPTVTPSPSSTAPATATTFLLPTSIIIPITREVPAPTNEVCASTWFFIQPRPPSCPVNPPNSTQGVFQTFQNGYMVWVQNQDAIYILYGDSNQPRWQVFRDYFEEGMSEVVGEFLTAPGPSLWQPRRGFGLIWRNNQTVRDRIGWATMEWEQPYSANVQTARDGALFLSQPSSSVFMLMPNGFHWEQYTGQVPAANTGLSGSTLPTALAPAPIYTLPPGG